MKKSLLSILAVLTVTAVFGNVAEGERGTMPTEPLLESATVAVQDKTMSAKFYYGSSQPTPQAQQAAEGFLRLWGGFKPEQHVYFMAGVDQGRYLLSLVSDPASWTETAFPAFSLKRLAPDANAFDSFEIRFNSEAEAAKHKDRLASALKHYVAVERGQRDLGSSIAQQGSTLKLSITQ